MSSPSSPSRWLTYQRERFPILAHAPLIAAFSYGVVCYSALLRTQSSTSDFSLPGPRPALTAFACCFLFFLQLRIADEFKDFDEDSRYRPYRPLPRGLISLRELATLGLIAALIQLAAAALLDPRLLALLAIVWVYFTLMSREFFIRDWIKNRHFTYLWSHMLIMPLIDLFATGCDWIVTSPRGTYPHAPAGLLWFLLASYFNGMVIELGRKIRAPADEEAGVPTYTTVWGPRRALAAWLLATIGTAIFVLIAAAQLGIGRWIATLMAILLVGAGDLAYRMLRDPTRGRAKAIEVFSGVWTIAIYAGLGIVPAIHRAVTT